MAKKESRGRSGGYEALRTAIKAGVPANLYIFYGEERYLLQNMVQQLKELLIPGGFEEFNYHRLGGKGLTVQELAETAEAMPMMAEHTLVTVTDLDIFKLDEGQRTALIELDHLLFTCGSLMRGLIPEIEKIAAYAKHERITIADIDAVAEPVLDARVFDMTRAVTERKYDRAAAVLGDLLRMQTEPIAILAVLGKELRKLYTARLALDGGKDSIWLKELWSMTSDYPAKMLLGAAKNVDHDWCRQAVKRCQRLDRRMKSERGMDDEGELKLFLMELAGGR